MHDDLKHTRDHVSFSRDVVPVCGSVRLGEDRPEIVTTYWGISCRTCQELFAFDACPYLSFGPEAVNMRPGAVRCSQGHNHIYFPKDFRFILSSAGITRAVMQEHRETHESINPASAAFNPASGTFGNAVLHRLENAGLVSV